MQCGQKRCFRSFLIHRPATDDHFAQARLFHEPRFERRRRPFAGVELFYVVHKVNADRLRPTRIHGSKDAGLAVRADDVGALEARVARQLRHILRAGGIITILGGNRRQCDPIAQPLEGFIMTFGDLTADVCEVVGGGT